jgi:hypothetical protein
LQPVTAGAASKTSAATKDPETFRDITRKSRPGATRLTSPKAEGALVHWMDCRNLRPRPFLARAGEGSFATVRV